MRFAAPPLSKARLEQLLAGVRPDVKPLEPGCDIENRHALPKSAEETAPVGPQARHQA